MHDQFWRGIVFTRLICFVGLLMDFTVRSTNEALLGVPVLVLIISTGLSSLLYGGSVEGEVSCFMSSLAPCCKGQTKSRSVHQSIDRSIECKPAPPIHPYPPISAPKKRSISTHSTRKVFVCVVTSRRTTRRN